jgi:hypothetical protein
MQLAKIFLRLRGAGALTDPDVAKALRLSETQVVRIKKAQRNNTASLRDRIRERLRRQSKDQVVLRSSLRELRAETDRHALAMLNDEQKAKLAQLQGTGGASDEGQATRGE